MNFDFSEEEQAISDLTQQIFEDKVTHEHLRSLAKSEESFDRDLWISLAETGIVGAVIDEEYGGAGLSFLSVTALLEMVGKYAAPVPALETVVTGALPIQEFGNASQKAEYLSKIADGQLIVTTALISSEEGVMYCRKRLLKHMPRQRRDIRAREIHCQSEGVPNRDLPKPGQ